MKKLFTLMVMALVAMGANAARLDLPIAADTDLDSGWDSSYDAASKTITYVFAWTGRGWYFESNDVGVDYSAYDNFVIELADVVIPEEGYLQVVIQYDKTTGAEESKKSVEAGNSKVIVPLDATGKAKISQIVLQGAANAEFTIKKAYLATTEATVDGADEGGEESTSLAINYAEMKAGDFTVENATKNETESKDTKTVYDIKGGEDLQFTLKTAPNVVFTITNGSDKTKVFNVNFNGDDTTDKGSVEFGGKNGIVIFKEAKVGDVIKMSVAAKGVTAANIGVLPSSGNDLITSTVMNLPKKDQNDANADAEGYVWKEFSFTVTEDMIKTLDGVKVVRVKETAAGYRCKAVSVNAPLPTGIQSVKAADTKSVNGAAYNLAGQKVNETYKGIVIKNGKKFIQK